MPSYTELQQQIAELQAQAEEVRRQEVEKVIADIKEKIAIYGLNAHDLGLNAHDLGLNAGGDAGAKKVRAALKAKYRDPATGETWVGRGATPKWMRAYLESGRNKEEFAI